MRPVGRAFPQENGKYDLARVDLAESGRGDRIYDGIEYECEGGISGRVRGSGRDGKLI